MTPMSDAKVARRELGKLGRRISTSLPGRLGACFTADLDDPKIGRLEPVTREAEHGHTADLDAMERS